MDRLRDMCTPCWVSGHQDMDTHKIDNCRRGVATMADRAFMTWRRNGLTFETRNCYKCCIPQVIMLIHIHYRPH